MGLLVALVAVLGVLALMRGDTSRQVTSTSAFAAAATPDGTGSPIGLYAFVPGNDDGSSATVQWDAVNAAPGITGWSIRRDGGTPAEDAGSVPVIRPRTDAAYTFTGLRPGTTYTFYVSGVETRGRQTEVSVQVRTAGPPAAPVGLSVRRGNASATLAWSPPSDTGGSGITGWHVVWVAAPGSPQQQEDLASEATSATVPGLIPGRSYHFQVSAVNRVGIGVVATADVVVPSVPGSPTSVQASPEGRLQAQVSWTPPLDPGGGLSVYVVRAYRVSGSRTVETLAPVTFAPGEARSVVVVLDAAGDWRFDVQAANEAGSSHVSARSAAVVVQ